MSRARRAKSRVTHPEQPSLRSEEQVPLADRVLIVEGRVSSERLEAVSAGLSRLPSGNEVLLVASFSYADLPLGKEFQVLFRVENPREFVLSRSRIHEVTQQF